jgi:long-chain acyl-CoA synthetase
VILHESAKERPALTLDGRQTTYAELNAEAEKFAAALAELGVKPRDKVAVMLPNVPRFAVAYYGILYAGASVVPLNVLLKAPEVSYHLEDSDSVALVAWEGFLGAASEGFDGTDDCRRLIVVEESGGEGAPEGSLGFEELLSASPAGFEPVLQRRVQRGQAPQAARGRR